LEKSAGPTGVFSSNQGNLSQDAEGSQGDVLEVADRSCHHIEDAGHHSPGEL
jgi:hypothetical protein